MTASIQMDIRDNNDKRKMLIVLDRYYPECNSATACIDNIIGPFSKDYDITVTCAKSDIHSPDTEIRNGVRIIRKHTIWDKSELTRRYLFDTILADRADGAGKAIKTIVRVIFYPLRKLTKAFGVYFSEGYSRRFGHLIEDEIRSSDVVLTTVMPYENAVTLCPVLCKYPHVKWIIIQSDPYVDYDASADVIRVREAEQNKWYDRATLIVAQETITDNIYRGSDEYKDKILPLFIPSMPSIITDDRLPEYREKQTLDQLNDTHKGSEHRISCVFTGLFYAGVREPYFLMDLFAQLHEQDPSVEVYVLGVIYDMDISGFISRNSEWFYYCGRQPQEICDRAQHEADFLINVGNMIPNLVPSKVMQYISTRKPIINLYHMRGDVVENYLADYPLELSLYYDDYINCDERNFNSVESLTRFIEAHMGQMADYHLIMTRYDKYSAENYVRTINESTLQN